MAQFNTSCSSSVPDAPSKPAPRKKGSVLVRVAVFEGDLRGAANTTSPHTPELHSEKRFTPHLKRGVRPPPPPRRVQSCKPAKTQRDSESSGAASARTARINYSRRESRTILEPEIQKPSVPSFPRVHQSIKLSLILQNSVKPPKLPEMPKPSTQKVPRESTEPSVPRKSLAYVLARGDPPPKPNRPPSVDLHRFRRNRRCLKDGPGMKIPCPAGPPPPRSSSNPAAVLSQQMDEDDSYDDFGTMNPPPLPNEEHPSKKTEIKGPAHVSKRKKSLVDSKGGKSDLSPNQGELTEVVHSTDEHVKPGDTRHDDLKEEEPRTESYQSDAESDIYDDIGDPVDVCRVSPLSQPSSDEDNVYDEVDSQSRPLPSDGYDTYVDVIEDATYEID